MPLPHGSPVDAGMLRLRPPFFLSSTSRPAARQDPQLPSFRPQTPEMADSDSSDCAVYGHRRRRQRSTTVSASQQDVIDLTKDSPPRPNSASHVFSASTAIAPERPFKRRRVQPEESPNTGSSSRPPMALQVDLTAEEVDETGEEVEELDLTLIETEEELHQKRAEQQERHERHQMVQDQQNHLVQESIQEQSDRSQGPLRLGELTCVICMETMTNMTATHCGHIFCHTCIMEALIAGERQSEDPSKLTSKCPVCRMRVLRNPKTGQPHVIPLELKLMTKSQIAKGKERA